MGSELHITFASSFLSASFRRAAAGPGPAAASTPFPGQYLKRCPSSLPASMASSLSGAGGCGSRHLRIRGDNVLERSRHVRSRMR